MMSLSLAAAGAAAVMPLPLSLSPLPLLYRFWMVCFAAVTVPFAPWTSDPVKYFRGGFVSDTKQDASNWLVLSSSAFVSWIFAKGILNTSTLGASFGVVGGLAYAAWVSLISVCLWARQCTLHAHDRL